MIDWLRPPVDGTPQAAFAASRVWVGRAVSLYKYLEGGIDISCRSGEDASCFHPTSRADRLLLPNIGSRGRGVTGSHGWREYWWGIFDVFLVVLRCVLRIGAGITAALAA